ncbi:EDR1-related protein [Pseudomonadota bacterium]
MPPRGRLYDPGDDWDYAQIALSGVPCILSREGSEKFQRGESARRGVFKTPIVEGGKPEMFNDEGKMVFQPSQLTGIEVNDDTWAIRLETHSKSVYIIEQCDPDNVARMTSLTYSRRGYLDYDDNIPNGFFDGGNDLRFEIAGRPMISGKGREVVIYGHKDDEGLHKDLETAEELLDPVKSIRDRIMLLALFVSNSLGGFPRDKDHKLFLEELMNRNVNECAKKGLKGVRTVNIGQLDHGVCRHRAGKFKYFGDRLDVPSRWVRGGFLGPHSWNAVKIPDEKGKEQYYLLDLMQNPYTLVPEDDPLTKVYHREGRASGYEGEGGMRSIGLSLEILRPSRKE